MPIGRLSVDELIFCCYCSTWSIMNRLGYKETSKFSHLIFISLGHWRNPYDFLLCENFYTHRDIADFCTIYENKYFAPFEEFRR